MTDFTCTTGNSIKSGLQVSSHSGSATVTLNGALVAGDKVFAGDRLWQTSDDVTHSWLITGPGGTSRVSPITGTSLNISRAPYSTTIDPSDSTNCTIARGFSDPRAWATQMNTFGVVSGIWRCAMVNDGDIYVTTGTSDNYQIGGGSGADGVTKYKLLNTLTGDSWHSSLRTPLFPSQSIGVYVHTGIVSVDHGAITMGAEQYIRIEDLQIDMTGTAARTVSGIFGYTNGKHRYNLIRINGGAGGGVGIGADNRSGQEVRGNVIILDSNNAGGHYGIDCSFASSGTTAENTVLALTDQAVKWTVGIYYGGGGAGTCQDNAVVGKFTDEFSGVTGSVTGGHNAHTEFTNTQSPPGGRNTNGNIVIATTSDEFVGVTIATADATPKTGNHLQVGVADSAIDAYGQTRANPPTIGAIEFGATPVFPPELSGGFRWQQMTPISGM